MIYTKFGAYRTNRYEVIPFLVNYRFFVGGHLGFWKMAVLTLPVPGRCEDEALCQIWWESDERFGSYSSFYKFQYGGRRPYWITNFDIFGHQACSGSEADDKYQIWCKSDEPFRSYSIFSKFQFFVGGHLGFWKNCGFDNSCVWAGSGRSSMPNLVRIRWTVRELFKFFANFKMAAGGHLG